MKPPRKAPPERLGVAYVGRRSDGAWLLETRAPDRMLGGMPGFPGSAWDRGEEDAPPPAPGDWQELAQTARHSFTHFTLTLRVRVARLDGDTTPLRGAFVPMLDPATLPGAMRRVWEVAQTSPLLADP